jgi:dCMP deaminase
MSRPGWPQHALNIAKAAALRSEDPYCQVGATVLNAEGIVLGVGYNGTVSGVEIDWQDREGRRPYVIHAEANALRYSNPEATAGGLLATTHFPCSACVLQAGSYGISYIMWEQPPDWATYPRELTEKIAGHLGITIGQILPPEEQAQPFTMADWLASTKQLQIDAYGGDPMELEPEERTAWARRMVLGLMAETAEVLGEIRGWRWWGPTGVPQPAINRAAYIEELVDVVHFAGALARAVDCTDAEWAEAYARKSAINRVRQGVQP